MNKKLLAIILAGGITLTSLVGCKGNIDQINDFLEENDTISIETTEPEQDFSLLSDIELDDMMKRLVLESEKNKLLGQIHASFSDVCSSELEKSGYKQAAEELIASSDITEDEMILVKFGIKMGGYTAGYIQYCEQKNIPIDIEIALFQHSSEYYWPLFNAEDLINMNGLRFASDANEWFRDRMTFYLMYKKGFEEAFTGPNAADYIDQFDTYFLDYANRFVEAYKKLDFTSKKYSDKKVDNCLKAFEASLNAYVFSESGLKDVSFKMSSDSYEMDRFLSLKTEIKPAIIENTFEDSQKTYRELVGDWYSFNPRSTYASLLANECKAEEIFRQYSDDLYKLNNQINDLSCSVTSEINAVMLP